jgi:hypothetical protein
MPAGDREGKRKRDPSPTHIGRRQRRKEEERSVTHTHRPATEKE